jgi:hypothetical protein
MNRPADFRGDWLSHHHRGYFYRLHSPSFNVARMQRVLRARARMDPLPQTGWSARRRSPPDHSTDRAE